MNRQTGMLIAFLIILSLALAYNTVTQTLMRTEKPPPPVVPAAMTPGAESVPGPRTGDSASAKPLPEFKAVPALKPVPPAKMVGEWVSGDPRNHRGLTRVTIAQKPGGLTVMPWSLHCTGEKPYSETKKVGATQDNPFSLTWETGFAEQKMRFAFLDDGRLQVDSVTGNWDPSGTQTPIATDFLTKATPDSLKARQKAVSARASEIAQAQGGSAPAKPGGT